MLEKLEKPGEPVGKVIEYPVVLLPTGSNGALDFSNFSSTSTKNSTGKGGAGEVGKIS